MLEMDEALPFEEGEGAPPPSAAQVVRPEATAKSGSLDQTAAMGMKLDFDDGLPFDEDSKADDLKLPELKLEQYASFCAELTVGGAAGEAKVLKRYGLPDEGSRNALDQRWRARLAKEPEQQKRFDGLVAQYQKWFKSQKRS